MTMTSSRNVIPAIELEILLEIGLQCLPRLNEITLRVRTSRHYNYNYKDWLMLQLKLTRSLITTGRSRVRLKSTKGPSIAVCSSLFLPPSPLSAICRICKPFSVTRIRLRAARGLHLRMKYPVLLDITHLGNWGKRIKNYSMTASIRFRSGNKGSVGVTRTRTSTFSRTPYELKLKNIRHVNNARMGKCS